MRSGATAVNSSRRKANMVMNGNFEEWSRGASISGASIVGPDRWRGNSAIASQAQISVAGSAGLPTGAKWGSLVTSTAGGGAIHQRVLSAYLRKNAGKIVTFSFRAGRVSGTTPISVNVRQANSQDNFGSQTLVYSSPSLGTPGIHTSAHQLFQYSFLLTNAMAQNGISLEIQGDTSVWSMVISQAMFNEGNFAAPFELSCGCPDAERVTLQSFYQQRRLAIDASGRHTTPLAPTMRATPVVTVISTGGVVFSTVDLSAYNYTFTKDANNNTFVVAFDAEP